MATEIFPPVIPSIARARNNTSKGRLTTKVPRALFIENFSTGRSRAKIKNTQPMKVPALLNRRIFFCHTYQTIFPEWVLQ